MIQYNRNIKGEEMRKTIKISEESKSVIEQMNSVTGITQTKILDIAIAACPTLIPASPGGTSLWCKRDIEYLFTSFKFSSVS